MRFREKLPGVLFCAAIAAIAWLIQRAEIATFEHAIFEGLVVAILLGMIARNTFELPKNSSAGISFVACEVLEFAVLLLGASVNFPELFAHGYRLLSAVVLLVVLGIVGSYFTSRVFGLNTKLAILIAVGNSICGNSAISAVAPVIEAKAEDVVSAIAFTAALGVIVVLALPLSIPALGLNYYQYGVLAGTGVYAVPQVVAAAQQVSDLSLRIATSVKLMRVLFIGPVVMFFSLQRHRFTASTEKTKLKLSKLVPWFVAGFLVLACFRSTGLISENIGKAIADTGKILTIASMAALGLGVELKALRKAGPRVVAAVCCSLAMLLALSVGLIWNLGIE